MGGRIAEELIFGQKTTGAGNDIERATDLAHKMVCEWGMSDRLGPITFGKKEEAIFLGREIQQSKNYSESTAQAIDQEIREVVERNYRRAKDILNSNIDILHSMATALVERETLDREEIELLMKRVKLPPKASKPEGGTDSGSAPATNEGEVADSGTPIIGTSPATV